MLYVLPLASWVGIKQLIWLEWCTQRLGPGPVCVCVCVCVCVPCQPLDCMHAGLSNSGMAWEWVKHLQMSGFIHNHTSCVPSCPNPQPRAACASFHACRQPGAATRHGSSGGGLRQQFVCRPHGGARPCAWSFSAGALQPCGYRCARAQELVEACLAGHVRVCGHWHVPWVLPVPRPMSWPSRLQVWLQAHALQARMQGPVRTNAPLYSCPSAASGAYLAGAHARPGAHPRDSVQLR